MNPYSAKQKELDQILMTMAGHDLKKIMTAVDSMLNTYLQGVNSKFIHTLEAQYIAEHISDLQHAARNMLGGIDEMLALLDKESPTTAPLIKVMQLIDEGHQIAPGQIPYTAANEAYAEKPTAAPPNFWHM